MKIKADYYFMAVSYNDGVYKLHDENEKLPDNARPITYGEFFSLMAYEIIDNVAEFATRFPITGLGSIVPLLPILITATDEVKVEYNGKKILMPDMRSKDNELFISMQVPYSRLEAYGGDHDGDKLNSDAIKTKQAVEEIKALLRDYRYYLESGFNGDLNYNTVENITVTLLNTYEKDK